MKKQNTILTLGVAAALTLVAGCDSKPADPGTAATNAASAITTEAGKALEAAKPAVEKAVTDAKAAATTAATDVTAKATSIIDQAKALVAQNKYSEATTALAGLSGLKLTDDQQKLVTGLKEQITKAMSGDGTKAVGDLLKK